MKVEIFQYTNNNGWSVDTFPSMDSDRTLIIIFASQSFKDNPQPFDAIGEFYKNSQIIGCSSSGEIFQKDVTDDSVVVAVIQFERTGLKMANITVNNVDDSFNVGSQIVDQLFNDTLSHIFLLSDGLNVNGSELVNGLNSRLPKKIPVTGGLAGDAARFKETWTYSKEEGFQANKVVAVGFYGSHVKITYGSQGGWDTFGPERVITKAVKNKVFEIDNQPALALYKKYLGELSKELPSSALLFPLAIRANLDEEKRIVRTILSVDESDQSMTFAGDVPEKWLAQLMTASFDRLIDGASSAAALTHAEKNHADILNIAISCVGRRLVLGERTEEEIEATLEELPPQTKQIGFYSYGEISPSGLTNCDLHNQTMTLTVITEE